MIHELWKLTEAAAFLGIAPGTLYAWVRLGKIPYLNKDGLVLFRRTDLEADFEAWIDMEA